MTVPDVIDILRRAHKLIASPLPHDWACYEYELGPYCVRCAVARSTTILTRLLPVGICDNTLRLAATTVVSQLQDSSAVLLRDEALRAMEAAMKDMA